MNIIKRGITLLLCLSLIAAGTSISEAATQITTVTTTAELFTSKETYILPMWHYSGKYWIIGSGNDTNKVSDKVIEEYDGLTDYLSENYNLITYKISLPDSVIQAREEGSEIKVSYTSRGNAPMDSIFVKNSIDVITDISDGKSYYEFTIVPKYNLVQGCDFTDFVSGLNQSIPLINYRFGNNTYSIFGNGKRAVQATGFFDAASVSTANVPYMHPSYITDKSGKLDSTHVISLGGKTVSTKGYSVGDSTFSAAGACGINFVFPINVVFTKVTRAQHTTEIPDSPEDPDTPQPPDTPIVDPTPILEPQPVVEPDPDVTDIYPSLSLPLEAYEGQTVTASDNSTFDFNGTYYSAYSAYTKGIADNSFDNPDARRISRTKTSVDIVYPEAGSYCVTLQINAASGEEAGDAKAINILPCPSVNAVLGGRQLENRKQTLSVRVQQNPQYPIKELTIKITEPISGENISVSRSFSGGQAQPQNTVHIKYRSLYDTGSDENSVACQLDFLSKFSDRRSFSYQVTATDSRGEKDTVEGSFTVEKDTPPVAKISLASRYYRNENSDTATITVNDDSQGSGNFQRIWTYEGSNYQDLSFGTGKSISFERQGVGEFSVGLSIIDLWTDETLEEYVSDEDHLRSSATASSVVDNIAPYISLEMKSAARKEILILASDTQEQAELGNELPSLKAELAGLGVNADIHVDILQSKGITKTGKLSFIRQISTPTDQLSNGGTIYYSQLDSPFWSTGHITADSSSVYSMDSGNLVKAKSKGSYMKRSYPFYIKAYDSRTGSEKWTYTITEGSFPSSNGFETAALGHDEQAKYLYLISNGKTLVIDKSNGAYIRMINAELGAFNFLQDGYIFTFKSDGIYRCSLLGLEKVYSAQIFTGQNLIRTIGGKPRFTEMKNGTVLLSTLSPSSATVTSIPLSGSDSLSETMAIDTRGNVLIRTNKYSFKLYSTDGAGCGNLSLDSSVSASVPSFDGSGRVNYVAGSYLSKSGSSGNRRYYNHMVLGALCTSYRGSNYIMKKDDYRSFSDVAGAIEAADGVVATLLPALVIVGDSLPLYSMTQFNFCTGEGTDNCGILVSSGMPPTDFVGWYESGTYISLYSGVYNNIAMVLNISESENDEIERLKVKWLNGSDGICLMAEDDLSAKAIVTLLEGDEINTQPPTRIYSKNEAIDYDIVYSDFEGDPSAASYWVYEHEAGRDGLWENSGKILNSPVLSFSKEGRYTLTHWQKDSACRGTVSPYDKESNRCTMAFYITGEESKNNDTGSAPVITSIETDPQSIAVGECCDIRVNVTDQDGDLLNVNVEVYRSGSSAPVKLWGEAVSPSSGIYPEIIVPDVPANEPGIYEIIVTASDASSTDVKSASFTPLVPSSLKAAVNHTDNWESNRQNFNAKTFGNPCASLLSEYDNYCLKSSPRMRGYNVFWPGEKLMLSAVVSGDVVSLTAEIPGYGYSTTLSAGPNNTYTGELYQSSMKKDFDKGVPLQVTIRFTAAYKNSAPLSFDVPIIFDEDTGYWALHRTL